MKSKYWKHIDSQNLKDIENTITEARVLKQKRIVDGFTGTGKSYACAYYKTKKPSNGIILTDCDGYMSPKEFGVSLSEACGLVFNTKMSLFKISRLLVAHIKTIAKTSDVVIIIDEAENLKPKAYHIIKKINDKLVEKNICGLVLVGANDYKAKIERLSQKNSECMPQIESRSEFLFRKLDKISIEDRKDVCRLNGITNVAVIDYISKKCGSYRSLSHVIPIVLYKAERLNVALTVTFCKSVFRDFTDLELEKVKIEKMKIEKMENKS